MTFRREGGGHKNQYRGRGFPKKGELGQSPDLRRVLEREGVVLLMGGGGAFEGGEVGYLQMHST